MIFTIFIGRAFQDSQHSYRHQYYSILSKFFFFRVSPVLIVDIMHANNLVRGNLVGISTDQAM
jgi:hypothetical protein